MPEGRIGWVDTGDRVVALGGSCVVDGVEGVCECGTGVERVVTGGTDGGVGSDPVGCDAE